MKLDVDLDELRTFAALRVMLYEEHPALQPWLLARQPATRTRLFTSALPPDDAADPNAPDEPDEPGGPGGTRGTGERRGADEPAQDRDSVSGAGPPTGPVPDHTVSLGMVGRERHRLGLESLRKHVADTTSRERSSPDLPAAA